MLALGVCIRVVGDIGVFVTIGREQCFVSFGTGNCLNYSHLGWVVVVCNGYSPD